LKEVRIVSIRGKESKKMEAEREGRRGKIIICHKRNILAPESQPIRRGDSIVSMVSMKLLNQSFSRKR